MKPTTTLASSTSPDGQVLLLQEHDGEYYLRIDGVPLMSTIAAASAQQMAEVSCRKMGGGARVLIGGLGFGFTLKRVLELAPPDATVEVAELLPVIVEWNRLHLKKVNGRLLDDKRVNVMIRDVYEAIARREGGSYDAILLDVDNSPDPLVQKKNARLYGNGGVGRIHSALRPGGRVVFWSANRDKSFERLLQKHFRRVESIGSKAYPQAKRFTHTLFVATRD